MILHYSRVSAAVWISEAYWLLICRLSHLTHTDPGDRRVQHSRRQLILRRVCRALVFWVSENAEARQRDHLPESMAVPLARVASLLLANKVEEAVSMADYFMGATFKKQEIKEVTI